MSLAELNRKLAPPGERSVPPARGGGGSGSVEPGLEPISLRRVPMVRAPNPPGWFLRFGRVDPVFCSGVDSCGVLFYGSP